jgi:hypothetical protein
MKHFPNAKLSIGGRPCKMTSAMEQSCVENLTRKKVSTTRKATKHVQEVFRIDVSEATKVRNPTSLGYASFYIVYSWMILTAIL